MLANPLATLVTHGQETVIERNGNLTHHEDCPLVLLQNTLNSFVFAAQSHSDFPFCGGALGLFNYDFGRRFENLPLAAEQNLTTQDMAVVLMTGR